MTGTTIPSQLRLHASERGDRPAYFHKVDGEWRPTTWRRLDEQVREVAAALIARGFEPGDTVGILGSNRPEWTLGALAAMTAGGAPVGIYTTSSPEQVGYIVDHAGCRALLVENWEQWARLEGLRGELPKLETVVAMEPGEPPGELADDPRASSWQAFLGHADPASERVLDERIESIDPDQLATLVYTSGTTGPPKGAMLSHANLVATARMGLEVFGHHADFCSVSYLPLAHIAEQMFSIHIPVYAGYPVYYVESFETLVEDVRTVQPTIFFGVPRVWERIHAALREKGAAEDLRGRLFRWALAVGRRVNLRRERGSGPGLWLGLQHRVADRLVGAKVRRAIGLGKARVCASGAAPIATEILEFFLDLGLPIYEVYGQTEVCGPTTWSRPGSFRLGTVGPPLPGIELRLADDGEIQVRGANVFRGYFRDPEATAEALEGGWLHSGDLGALDADGFLTITGRKKDIIITSTGKNIAPANIEAALKNCDLVADALVVGEGQRYLAALLTLDRDAVRRLGAELGTAGAGDLDHRHPALTERLQQAVEAVNGRFSHAERVRGFRVLEHSFSIEAGEITPTMKVRRQAVCERYREVIEELYTEGAESS